VLVDNVSVLSANYQPPADKYCTASDNSTCAVRNTSRQMWPLFDYILLVGGQQMGKALYLGLCYRLGSDNFSELSAACRPRADRTGIDNSPQVRPHPVLHRQRQLHLRSGSQFKNDCLVEMWSGSEEGSYLRLVFGVLLDSRRESNKDEQGKLHLRISEEDCAIGWRVITYRNYRHGG